MLHPQSRNVIDLIESRGIPPMHTLTPSDARIAYRERRSLTQPAPPQVALVQNFQIDGPHGSIPVRLYRPVGFDAALQMAALVYFHGGGWVIGDLDTHDTLCRELANGAGCVVISVDYRLAPEHPFPAGLNDAIAATRWVQAHAGELHIDASRLAVGGDSAGANLAAVVAIDARDHGDQGIAFQLLIYPATDLNCNTTSYIENGDGYLLTRETMAYYIGEYITDPTDYKDWRASPLLHPDLSNLPPALVLTAGFDPLRDEGAAYALRLTQSGNSASYVCFERQIHGFITMGRVISEAHTAVALCAAELKRALSR
jgi:acetyl esterase